MTKRRICVLIAVLSMLAVGRQTLAHPGGVNEPSPTLPPIIVPGVYLSPSDVHAKYAGPALEVVLSMVEHQPFAGSPPITECTQPGSVACEEHHHFDSMLDALVSINGGPDMPIQMQGPVHTVAHNKSNPTGTGTFDTEMLSMQLVALGNPMIMIRESPTRASTGVTSITDIGPPGPGDGSPDQGWHIDSFFDVFTELSLDGGATWIPKAGPRATRVHLGGVPEPTSLVLLALGVLGVAGLAGRRR